MQKGVLKGCIMYANMSLISETVLHSEQDNQEREETNQFHFFKNLVDGVAEG